MVSVPALAEKDLKDALEGEFGIPVALRSPEGAAVDATADGRPLRGFVRRSYPLALENGEKTVVNSPVVRLRASSLAEIPESGAEWLVGIPESPIEGAALEWFRLDPAMPVERNKGRGTVKLYLAKRGDDGADCRI